MGEEAMVMKDVTDSARLVGYLAEHGSSITAAILAHDIDLDSWRLLLAVPRSSTQSKKALYTAAQAAITELGLSLSLTRISRILDTEPLVGTLSKIVEDSFTNVVEVPLGGAELDGASVDRVFTFGVNAIRYEEAVFSALQRVRPPSTDLRRSDSLSLHDRFDFDFILDAGTQKTIIETRSIRRPLVSKDLQRLSAMGEEWVGYLQASLVIVAKNGFALVPGWESDLSQQLERLRRIIPVKWDGEGDDQALSVAISLSMRPEPD